MKVETNKNVKVKLKKLGREGAWGQACTDTGNVELDTRIKGRHKLRILCHEILHVIFPEMSEAMILKVSKVLSYELWKQNYRQVDNKIK